MNLFKDIVKKHHEIERAEEELGWNLKDKFKPSDGVYDATVSFEITNRFLVRVYIAEFTFSYVIIFSGPEWGLEIKDITPESENICKKEKKKQNKKRNKIKKVICEMIHEMDEKF